MGAIAQHNCSWGTRCVRMSVGSLACARHRYASADWQRTNPQTSTAPWCQAVGLTGGSLRVDDCSASSPTVELALSSPLVTHVIIHRRSRSLAAKSTLGQIHPRPVTAPEVPQLLLVLLGEEPWRLTTRPPRTTPPLTQLVAHTMTCHAAGEAARADRVPDGRRRVEVAYAPWR